MKAKYWATEIYEESKNKYFLEILEESHLPIAISPIHDKDKYTKYDIEKAKEKGREINYKEGDYKKPHRHILIEYGNTTTKNNLEPLIEEIGGVGLIPIKSKIGYYDYLTHKNNKEKAQYKEEEIIKLNGFEIEEKQGIPYNKVEKIKREIIEIINDNNIIEYSELIDAVKNLEEKEYLEVASNKTFFFSTYITSRRFKENNK